MYSIHEQPDLFHEKKLSFYFFLAGIEAILGIIILLLIPADIKNQWLFGYSFNRIILFFLFLMAGFISFFMAHGAVKKKTWLMKAWHRLRSIPHGIAFFRFFSALLLILLFAIVLTPSIRFGIRQVQLERLLSLIWFLILVSVQTILLINFWSNEINWRNLIRFPEKQGVSIIFFILSLSLIILAWSVIGLTGVGVEGNWGLWVEAGVPILLKQILFLLSLVVVLSTGLSLLMKICRLRRSSFVHWANQNQDILISIALWVITFSLWVTYPIQNSYFFPGPSAPNQQFFPFSDAATWDLHGQNALIGQGFANGDVAHNHLGLSAFLAILHLIVGQNYTSIISAQLIFFALFPVFLYLLTKAMHSRPAGLFIAGLAIVHQLNSFASENIINLSHAKLLMTEFPTGLGLVLLAFLLYFWAQNKPENNLGYLIPIGGILSILILIRFNLLAMPFAVAAGIVIILWGKWKKAIYAVALLGLSSLITLSPWMIHSWQITGSPLFFMGRASAIFDADFRAPPKADPSPSSFKLPENSQSFSMVNYHPQFSKQPTGSSHSADTPTTSEAIINHFVHNFVTSVLILPASPYLYDLEAIIHDVSPFWDRSRGPWYGDINLSEGIFIFFNLVILSLGLSLAWKRGKIAGLIPLGILVAFNLFLAVARTSGGRYIVPIEWAIYLYYGLGVFQIAVWVLKLFGIKISINSDHPIITKVSIKMGVFLTLPFVLFVASMVVMDQMIPSRYEQLSKIELLEKVVDENLLDGSDIEINDLRVFLDMPGTEGYFGRNLYPRFYLPGQGEYSSSKTVFAHYDFPRLGFILIGPFENKTVLLPLINAPTTFPHAADTLVIGCANQTNPLISIDALLVIVQNSDGSFVYLREPDVPLSCPFPEFETSIAESLKQ